MGTPNLHNAEKHCKACHSRDRIEFFEDLSEDPPKSAANQPWFWQHLAVSPAELAAMAADGEVPSSQEGTPCPEAEIMRL